MNPHNKYEDSRWKRAPVDLVITDVTARESISGPSTQKNRIKLENDQ